MLPSTPPAPNFALHDQDGRAVSLAGAARPLVVVTFLYTHCPDVCPVIAGNLNGVLADRDRAAGRAARARGQRRPARDTPAAVAPATSREHRLRPAFRYLLGSRAELAPVWQAYHVAVVAGPSGSIGHALDRSRSWSTRRAASG